MINIDSKLLEALQESTCFGIGHDETVPECKMCDVRGQCKARSAGVAVPTPKTRVSNASGASKTNKKTVAKPTKPDKPKAGSKSKAESKPKPKNVKKDTPPVQSGNMPVFKEMSLDKLKGLAKERNVEWKDYNNDNITRMKLIMNLKKSY